MNRIENSRARVESTPKARVKSVTIDIVEKRNALAILLDLASAKQLYCQFMFR